MCLAHKAALAHESCNRLAGRRPFAVGRAKVAVMAPELRMVPVALRSFSEDWQNRVALGEWCTLCDLPIIALAFLQYVFSTSLHHRSSATTFLDTVNPEHCQCPHCLYTHRNHYTVDKGIGMAA